MSTKITVTRKSKVLFGKLLEITNGVSNPEHLQLFEIDPYETSFVLFLEKRTRKLHILDIAAGDTTTITIPTKVSLGEFQKELHSEFEESETLPRSYLEWNSFFIEVKKRLQRKIKLS